MSALKKGQAPQKKSLLIVFEDAERGGQGSYIISPREPRVTLQVGGKPVNFLVDTGATYLSYKVPRAHSQRKRHFQGATGQEKSYPWTQARITDLGKGTITRSFLVMPECLYPLLGKDLLQKLQATISFKEGHTELTVASGPPDRWISNARITQYQVMLLNPPHIQFLKTVTLPDEAHCS
uniref:Peptidase A2 domain-containing protein n=1 Tax=Rousettus aegyptiacus TaxID=9407 RepID=A0A7J8H193_ROUAE|nr:hypothetical protein HJG63_011396 [Rousettus aegyptiacus]